jgi:hypothetical protein
MGKSFLKYYIGTVIKPDSTFEELITDDRKLTFGFYSELITAILYTFVYILSHF